MSVSGAKPFSLQAPEAIAKQYQGNKQKIAQAVQLGLVDATAGTLAGMFIDRMRAAAMQEQGPPQTVAQQVLGSNPPAPPPGGPPMAPMAGGAPPPPMPMPQGAPPASPAAPMGGPPVQAAEGGLMSIPIPDTMFDEPEGTSMARGGLVAFAEGKEVIDPSLYALGLVNAKDAASEDDEDNPSWLDTYLNPAAVASERDARTIARNRQLRAQDPKNYISPEASGFGELLGRGPKAKAYRAELGEKESAVKARTAAEQQRGRANQTNILAGMFGGQQVDVPAEYKPAPKPKAPTGIPDIRVDGTPKPKEGERFIGRDGRVYTQQTPKAPEAPDRKIVDRTNVPRVGGGLALLASSKSDKAAADKAAATPPTAPTTVAEDLKMIQGLMQDPETKAYMDGQTARLAKQKKEDVWSTLAQIGFGMAASKSPTLLGAIGEAGTAALPTAQKAIQARRAAEADFAKQRMEQRGRDVTAALGYNQNQTGFGIEREKIGVEREKMGVQAEQFKAQMAQALQLAQMNVGAQLAAARISLSRDQQDAFHTTLRTKIADIQRKNPNMDPREVASMAADATFTTMGYKNPPQGGGPGIETLLDPDGSGGRGRSAIPAGVVQKIG